jgi:hypothetical protein
VTLQKRVDGVLSRLAGPVEFRVTDLDLSTLPVTDPAEALAFDTKVADLERAVSGAVKAAGEAEDRLAHIRQAILDTPAADPDQLGVARNLQTELDDIQIALVGDPTKEERNVFTPPSIADRVNRIVRSQWTTTQGPTRTQRDTYGWAAEAFTTELGRLRNLMDGLQALEHQLELDGAPWTPGRLPDWKPE